jgi:hypothetical protein
MAALSVIERLTPNEVYRVPTDNSLGALSFDDGPNPTFTPQVLDILERHEAKAAFFLTGERASQYPELVARIKADGHEVGNHYYKNGSTLPSLVFALSRVNQSPTAGKSSAPARRLPAALAAPTSARFRATESWLLHPTPCLNNVFPG